MCRAERTPVNSPPTCGRAHLHSSVLVFCFLALPFIFITPVHLKGGFGTRVAFLSRTLAHFLACELCRDVSVRSL